MGIDVIFNKYYPFVIRARPQTLSNPPVLEVLGMLICFLTNREL
jgi:hypothetical protein